MAIHQGFPEVVNRLLKAGGSPELSTVSTRCFLFFDFVSLFYWSMCVTTCSGQDGKSPLAFASESGREEVVRELVAGGADVHRKNSVRVHRLVLPDPDFGVIVLMVLKEGQTAVQLACLRGHAGVLEVLLAAGAEVTLESQLRSRARCLLDSDATTTHTTTLESKVPRHIPKVTAALERKVRRHRHTPKLATPKQFTNWTCSHTPSTTHKTTPPSEPSNAQQCKSELSSGLVLTLFCVDLALLCPRPDAVLRGRRTCRATSRSRISTATSKSSSASPLSKPSAAPPHPDSRSTQSSDDPRPRASHLNPRSAQPGSFAALG
eukprot:1490801-Rhodomonas_salina.4